MKNIVKFLLNPLFISVIGLCALGVVIWFAGPLIAFNETRYLESETARLIAILAVTLIWGLNNFRLQNQQKKKDSAMMGEIAQVTNSKSVRNSEESQVLHKHFQDALR
ncbi:MAG TPA: hypothetical protein ENK06_04360, partial [Gammaproteobacteria bacterium]|nr:hypothetical protein [Gammaproteobacteria bacterium]